MEADRESFILAAQIRERGALVGMSHWGEEVTLIIIFFVDLIQLWGRRNKEGAIREVDYRCEGRWGGIMFLDDVSQLWISTATDKYPLALGEVVELR